MALSAALPGSWPTPVQVFAPFANPALQVQHAMFSICTARYHVRTRAGAATWLAGRLRVRPG